MPGGASQAQAGATTAVKIVSAGYEDGNRADFYFDGRVVGINGFFDRRGANVVVIDPDAGEVTLRKSYDIWGDPQTVNQQFSTDLRGIPQGHIVLVACKDSGFENLDSDAINALRGVGATIAGPLGVREGYALIGVSGGPAWAENQGKSCEVEWEIPCAVEFPPPPPPMPQLPPQQPGMPGAAPGGFPPGPAAPQPGGFGGGGMPPPPQPRPPPGPPPIDVQPSRPESAPKVDLAGGAAAGGGAEKDEEGRSWEEVVLMLDRLQEKIKAKRLAGLGDEP